MSLRIRKAYVAGFMFRKVQTEQVRFTSVLLVKKNKPDWQRGLWNGIGGKLEEHENPIAGMKREFGEETSGYSEGWEHFCTEFVSDAAVVYFFRCEMPQTSRWEAPPKNDVGEDLQWVILPLTLPAIGNLSWLVPLALDPRGLTDPVVVHTVRNIVEIPTW